MKEGTEVASMNVRDGIWVNEPPSWEMEGEGLEIVTGFETDFWRHTSYGFVHHSGHGLVSPLADGEALELSVVGEFDQSFDQAGILVWADEAHWVKCGVEYADGVLGLGAVVTDDVSDWSTAPVPEWAGQVLHMRVSRRGDALTIRAKIPGLPWRLVRVAPIDPSKPWQAGPFAASPTREGLRVRFSGIERTAADTALHD